MQASACLMWIRLIAAIFAIASGVSHAQSFPSRSVRIIVPNSAGGPSDLCGRLLAQKLSELWGQAVIVENRVGASGNIGVEGVVRAAPDGYTLLVTNSAPIAINQSLYAKMTFDPAKDLAAISQLATAPEILTVPTSLPANSVAELIGIAKAEPGKLTFASLGNGTAPHLGGELFKFQAGVDILHIPYRSVPQLYAAVIVGEVSMYFGAPTVLAQVRAGKMKALAVTSKTRVSQAPHLPTLAESGLPDYEHITWFGLLAPAGISEEIKAQVHAATVKAFGLPDVKAKLNGIGFEAVTSTPAQFAAQIQSESARWAHLIKTMGVRIN